MTQPAYAFDVSQVDVFTEFAGARVPVAGRKAVIRTDTGEPLSIVGSRYQPVRHEKVIDLASQALQNLGLGSTMSVKMPGKGCKLYAHFRIDEKALVVGDPKVNDLIALEIIARNSLDGTSPVSVELCGRRLVCLNGLALCTRLMGFHGQHTKHLELGSLTATVERAIRFFQTEAVPHWNRLTSTALSHEAGAKFLGQLRERGVLPQRYADMAVDQWNAAQRRTGWDLLNAVTWVISHEIEPKSYLRARTIGLAVDREFRALTA